ncbi:MAG: hypothetical protein GX345_00515 [Clostridiales bacterium]|nr:hypothetical protein [Clostridiales bacterium]
MKKTLVSILIAGFLIGLVLFLNPGGISDKIRDFDLLAYLDQQTDWDSVPAQEPTQGSPYKYYYKQLSNKEKHAYKEIYDNIFDMPEEIPIPFLTQEELENVFQALLYDDPYLFFVGRKCTLTTKGTKSFFNAEYILSAHEYDERRRLLEAKVYEAVQGIDLSDDFENELYIHDYVVNTCSYSGTGVEDENTAYGALINRKAACEGYSKAVKILLDFVGIESYVLTGDALGQDGTSEPHMWNIVKIEGDYYHLDSTWDDPVIIGGREDASPKYSYFNLSDKEISITHKNFTSSNLCTAIKANYFFRKGSLFDSYDRAARQKTLELLVDAAENHLSSFQIKFSDKEAYKKTLNSFAKEGELHSLIYDARSHTSKTLPYNPALKENDDFNIIEIFLLI